MANTLEGLHLQVVPANCGRYAPCEFGVYLDSDVGSDPIESQAVFQPGTAGLHTAPHRTEHVPGNILFIPEQPLGDLDDSKLFREAHPQAVAADKKKQVKIGFVEPATSDPVQVKLWAEQVNGNLVVHVDLADQPVRTSLRTTD